MLTRRKTRETGLKRRPTAKAALIGLAGTTAAGILVSGAGAAVPTFPDNLVVFPNRDFITVEGFQNHVGETATVKVTRAGEVVGSAQARVAEGEVAFEINHPGGVCWGAGTTLNVTPDIVPGDKVSIEFAGDAVADTTVQETYVDTDTVLDAATNTVTIEGHIADGVNTSQLEQRIINPDLTDTVVGRRDARATPGPVVPSDKGGYSSGLRVEGNRFTATYVFNTAEAAGIAASGGGERMMSWQVEDADGNRQGLSIAEYGETGGPGMGGCPAGPAEQAAPKPGTASAIRSTDKASLQVAWTPATPVPGAAAVDGYNVVAIEKGTGAQKSQSGFRTDASSDKATITGLDPALDYTVEVRSLTGAKMSDPMTVTDPIVVPGDNTPPEGASTPTLTASPAANADSAVEADAVTLSTDGSEIYYTTDGSDVSDAGAPSLSAELYTGAIKITELTTIKAIAYNAGGYYTLFEGRYTPSTAAPTPPDAPTITEAVAGQGSVALRWSAGDTSVTGYGVQVYSATDEKVGPLRETTNRSLTIDQLTPGEEYFFTVSARNEAGYGPESAKIGPRTPAAITDRVTITSARYRQGDRFEVGGTGSLVGATITVHRANATNTGPGTAIAGAQTQVTAAPAPATGGVWQVRMRDGATPATNPGVVWVKSSGGGIAGPFTTSR